MIILIGIVRGSYSKFQPYQPEEPAVMSFAGESLEEVVTGLVLPEWIYKLYVNGRRIANPERYLKRKGLWNKCVREAQHA